MFYNIGFDHPHLLSNIASLQKREFRDWLIRIIFHAKSLKKKLQ